MTVKMDNAQDGCQSEYSGCCKDCTGCMEPWTRYKLPYNCSSITHYNDATIQTNSSSPIECDLGAPMLTDLSPYDAELLKVRAHCIHDYLDSLHFVDLFITSYIMFRKCTVLLQKETRNRNTKRLPAQVFQIHHVNVATSK